MSQLTFPWCETDSPLPSATESKKTALGSHAAAQCRQAAEAMEKHIRAKHESATNMLSLPPTRKRLQDGERLRRQATLLERVQRTLYVLTEMHDKGAITPELASLRTRGAVESALFNSASDSSIHTIFKGTERSETTAERVRRLTQEALLRGIPGYFPTPPEIAEKLVDLANFQDVGEILEPSAGTGSLIDAVLKIHPKARIAFCEINTDLLELLRLKYESFQSVRLLGRDFRELANRRSFNAIIMNPPFEKGEDIDHVLRAHSLLTQNGTLAAIVSEGAFFRKDKKATAFQQFLAKANVESMKLPPSSFKSSGTEVSCRIIRLRK